MKHTSGPWHRNIKPAKKYVTIFAGRNTHICHLATEGLTDAEIEANCDLITCAPDMLIALKAFVEQAEKLAGFPHLVQPYSGALVLARAIVKSNI